MQSIKLFPLIFILVLLTACVSPIPLEKQLAQINYQMASPILIAVIDKRKRLSTAEEIEKDQKYNYDDEEKGNTSAVRTEHFAGRIHGLYGIPSDWTIKNIAPREEDKDKTLAEFLEERIVKGLKKNNWDVKAVHLKTANSAEAQQALVLYQDKFDGFS